MADAASPVRSRRAILAGLVGGLAATAFGTVGRALPASAGTGSVLLGADNTTADNTSIERTAGSGDAFSVYADGSGSAVVASGNSGAGLSASSASGPGIYAFSDSGMGTRSDSGATHKPALLGWSGGNNTGVQGYSGNAALPASPARTGVYGYADQTAGSVGVRGRSPTGRGAVLIGKVAQLRLQPSADSLHPISGQAGDLFVDHSNRLWFCRGGSTWVRLA